MKFVVFVSAAALCIVHAWASAQMLPKDYPNKPIRVVIPHPAGGAPDLVMRLLLPKYNALLGQLLVIDNRAGAGGIIGSAVVVKAPPDGYTWLFNTASHTNTAAVHQEHAVRSGARFFARDARCKECRTGARCAGKVSDKTVQELIARARRIRASSTMLRRASAP